MVSNEKTNSEIFIELFTEIEQRLKTICNDEFTSNFSELLAKARSKNGVVNRYASDLKEFAQLRNAIVHTRRQNFVIAEPHDDVVNEIIHINKLLNSPPKISSVMKRNPFVVSPETPIRVVLNTFAEKGFMRCPVVEQNRIICLITAKTISRWITSIKQERIEINDTPVRKLIPYTEKSDYMVVAENEDIATLLDQFTSSIREGNYLQAALVTQSGDPGNKLVGIVTPSDLPLIMEKLK